MKIAFFVSEFPTLSETFILNQIVGLIDQGFEIEIYPSKKERTKLVHPLVKKYKLLNKTHCLNVPENRLFRWPKFVFLFWLALLTKPSCLKLLFSKLKVNRRARLDLFFRALAIKNKRFDIIHCHFGPNGKQAIFLRQIGLIQGKIITSFHGYDFSIYVKKQGKNTYRQVFRQSEAVTVNSNFTKKKVEALGCPKNKIIKLPESLRIKEFVFKSKTLKSNEKIKLLTVARLEEKKGIEYSIQAVAQVLKKHPQLEYQIAGDGPLKNELSKLIKQLQAEKKIKLLGWQNQNQIQKLYQQSHLFILASLTTKSGDQEGQGLVLQEAQACGLPLVATLHNGFSEGVLDGQSGFLVPEGDVKALAKKLEYLITHPQIWPKMGRTGRKFVEKRYDSDRLNKQLVSLYQKLLSQ